MDETTNNKQQTTNNKQQTTNNKQQTTSNKQQATNNKQQTTSNQQQVTSNNMMLRKVMMNKQIVRNATSIPPILIMMVITSDSNECLSLKSTKIRMQASHSPHHGVLRHSNNIPIFQ